MIQSDEKKWKGKDHEMIPTHAAVLVPFCVCVCVCIKTEEEKISETSTRSIAQ